MEKLTASLEDYLEVICNCTNDGKVVRAIDISKELKVSRASVTEALKKLASKGFVNYGRYDTLSLTEQGKDLAQQVISKHHVLQTFFEQVLGLDTKEASENACRIEHVITENAFNKFISFVETQRVEG